MVAEPLRDLFARVARGELRVVEGEVYPLSEAAPRARGPAGAAAPPGKLLLDPAR